MQPVIRFSDQRAADAALVGGKGANLGRLTHAGFPVPAGFTVTTGAYEEFLAGNGLGEAVQSILRQIDFDDAAGVDKRAAEIRALYEEGPLPAAVVAAIRDGYAELGDEVRVAVRSSGTAEDLEGASFAGQHDTYLHIRGADAVLDAVRRCWASLWTARATAYRAHKGFAQDEISIAVVVQTMVDSEVAGVMFTANPIAGLTTEMCINASWGLGEALVSGMITPDLFTLDVDTLKVKEQVLGTKELRIRLDQVAGAGTVTEETPAADRMIYSLTDRQLGELGALGRRVMAHYDGLPQDIEWGLVDGTFYLLQARPVTGAVFSWDEDIDFWHRGPYPTDTLWTRTWSDEGWTGAITPLFFSIRGHGFCSWHVAGHQLALNIAAGLQLGGSESYPGVFQPYGGFADNIPIVDGYVRPHEQPGIGMELRVKMFAEMRRRLEFA